MRLISVNYETCCLFLIDGQNGAFGHIAAFSFFLEMRAKEADASRKFLIEEIAGFHVAAGPKHTQYRLQFLDANIVVADEHSRIVGPKHAESTWKIKNTNVIVANELFGLCVLISIGLVHETCCLFLMKDVVSVLGDTAAFRIIL